MSSKSASPLAYSVLIVAQLAVGSAAILARSGLAAGLEPVSLAAWRLTLAAGGLGGVAGGRRGLSDRSHRSGGSDRSAPPTPFLVLGGGCPVRRPCVLSF